MLHNNHRETVEIIDLSLLSAASVPALSNMRNAFLDCSLRFVWF